MSNELKKMTAKDGESKDLIAENVDKLKQLFPEIVTEGKIDFDTLKEVLGDFSDDRLERYSFTWNGKTEARKLAMTPSKGTLRPAPEESFKWDSTQNVFIEGDNLVSLPLNY
jgi:adenine-specific DNA-methyltransferase